MKIGRRSIDNIPLGFKVNVKQTTIYHTQDPKFKINFNLNLDVILIKYEKGGIKQMPDPKIENDFMTQDFNKKMEQDFRNQIRIKLDLLRKRRQQQANTQQASGRQANQDQVERENQAQQKNLVDQVHQIDQVNRANQQNQGNKNSNPFLSGIPQNNQANPLATNADQVNNIFAPNRAVDNAQRNQPVQGENIFMNNGNRNGNNQQPNQPNQANRANNQPKNQGKNEPNNVFRNNNQNNQQYNRPQNSPQNGIMSDNIFVSNNQVKTMNIFGGPNNPNETTSNNNMNMFMGRQGNGAVKPSLFGPQQQQNNNNIDRNQQRRINNNRNKKGPQRI